MRCAPPERPAGRGQVGSARPRNPEEHPYLPVFSVAGARCRRRGGNRTQDVGAGRQLRGLDQLGDRRRRSEGRAHPDRGGNRSCSRSASSRSECMTGSQRIRACTGRQRGVGDHDHPAALGGRPDQRRRVQPPAQRLLAGAQVGPAEQRPAVEQQGRRVPAVGDRLGARGRHHQRRASRAPTSSTACAARGAHRDAGERAAQLLGGARRAGDDARSRRARTAGTASRGQRPAPGARWGGAAAAPQRQRPGARRAPGRRRGSARRPRRRGSRAAAPGRAPGRGASASAGGAQGQAGQPGGRARPRPGPARRRRRCRGSAGRSARTAGRPATIGVRPAGWTSCVGLGGPGEPADQRRSLLRGARAAAAPRGRAGTARAARRAGRRRRPRPRPGPGRGPARTSPPGCRPRPAPRRAARPASGGTRSAGPSSAARQTCRPWPSSAVSAASSRARSRASGTTTRAPRPAEAAVAAARAISSAQCGPGQRRPDRARRPAVGQRGQERRPRG